MDENRMLSTPAAGSEEEIDLMSLLVVLLRRIVPIVLTAVVCTALFGGVAALKAKRAAASADDAEYEKAVADYLKEKADYEFTLEQYDDQIESNRKALLRVQDALEQAQVHQENALLAELNAYDVWTAQADLYVGGNTAALAAYQSQLLTGESLQQAADAAGLAGKDLTGAVMAEPAQDGSMLTLRACAADQARAEALLNALLDRVNALHDDIAAAVGSHEVQVLGRSVSAGMSEALLASQQAERAEQQNLQEQLSTLLENRQALDTNLTSIKKNWGSISAPTRSGNVSVPKYAAIGFVLGGVLACGIVVVKFLMSGLVYSANELARTTGLPVLGALASDRTKKASRLDVKLNKLENRPDGSGDAEMLCLMAQTIRSRVPEAKNILVTGDLPADQLNALAAALQATEALRGQNVTAADSILKAAATVPHVVAADAVVLAADCTCTKTESVREQNEKITRLGKSVLGCIVYE